MVSGHRSSLIPGPSVYLLVPHFMAHYSSQPTKNSKVFKTSATDLQLSFLLLFVL